jgi:glutamyl-tRNA(Gln) amidotransferase subunit E
MSKLLDYKSISKEDLNSLGLKSGIEIHQQLNTGKLFCNCPCEIVENNLLDKKIIRKLRFSFSEKGNFDRAALEEFKKGKYNEYLYNEKVACLVDLDEEPPHEVNKKALNLVLSISKLLNLNFFKKFIFMRKLIIDGSVTSGFQRTAIIGVNGFVETSFGKVGIEGVNLEEDSARNIEKRDGKNIYSLDRQGIPLIEITTAPDAKTPQQVKELAEKIGDILRSFSLVKRGLGTIRQDLNISIKGGKRVEIKGAQNLKLIDKIVESEMKRQKVLISISEELKNRNISKENFTDFKIYNVSDVFKNTTSKVVLDNLKEKDSGIFAIKLKGFKNILGVELFENYRFATEISNRNKAHFPQIKGLFHSDELPKYGITEKEVEEVRKNLGLEELDSFILIVNNEKIAKESLLNIFEIIKELMDGPIEEVRQVDPKGVITKPLRSMPGSARMYPETDVLEIEFPKDFENNFKVPELYSKKLKRLSKVFGVEEEKIDEILEIFTEEEYNNLLSFNIKPTTLYSFIFEILKEIKKKELVQTYFFEFDFYNKVLKLVEENKLNKNSIYSLYVLMFKNNLKNVENLEEFLEKNNLISNINEKELDLKLKEIINKNKGAPFGALMGIAMEEFKGKVDGKILSNKIKELIN